MFEDDIPSLSHQALICSYYDVSFVFLLKVLHAVLANYVRERQEKTLAFLPRLCHHLPSASSPTHCWLQTHFQ